MHLAARILITVLYNVYTKLVLQLCRRSGPTGYPRKCISEHGSTCWEPRLVAGQVNKVLDEVASISFDSQEALEGDALTCIPPDNPARVALNTLISGQRVCVISYRNTVCALKF